MWLPPGRQQLPKGITDLAIVPRAKSVPGERGWPSCKATPASPANLVSGLFSAPGSHGLLVRQPGGREVWGWKRTTYWDSALPPHPL